MKGQGKGYKVAGSVGQVLRWLTSYFLLLTTFLILPGMALAISAPEIGQKACDVNPDALGCGSKGLFGAGSIFNSLIDVIIFVIGGVSVLMIVIGGLRYTLSGGDSAGTKSAKDTILYALIGLGVAIFSWTIVTFVIGKVG